MSRIIILQHIEREGPGLFLKVANKRKVPTITCRLDLGESIPDIEEGDLLLVLGGPMGLGDLGSNEYPWLNEEISLLKLALIKHISVIGVCLGAQLLAYAAGGQVEPLRRRDGEKNFEVGWGDIYFSNNTNTFSIIFNRTMQVLHWHGDRIILPDCAELIASNEVCKEQFFSINAFAYGIQSHVEVDSFMFDKWLLEDQEFIKNALGDKGANILKNQHNQYEKNTLKKRIKFINLIYDILKL